MQFGFLNNHSTVLCTAIYIETINHYMNEGGVVMFIVVLLVQEKLLTGYIGGRFSLLIGKKVSYISSLDI